MGWSAGAGAGAGAGAEDGAFAFLDLEDATERMALVVSATGRLGLDGRLDEEEEDGADVAVEARRAGGGGRRATELLGVSWNA